MTPLTVRLCASCRYVPADLGARYDASSMHLCCGDCPAPADPLRAALLAVVRRAGTQARAAAQLGLSKCWIGKVLSGSVEAGWKVRCALAEAGPVTTQSSIEA